MAFSALKAVDAEGRRRKGTKQNSTSLELSLELVQMLDFVNVRYTIRNSLKEVCNEFKKP